MLVTLTVTTTGLKSLDDQPELIGSLDDGTRAADRHPERRSTARKARHLAAPIADSSRVRSSRAAFARLALARMKNGLTST